MIERSLKTRVLDFLSVIPDLNKVEMNPSVFSDDIEGHDCDKCSSSEYEQGDTFDYSVCVDCWEQAIIKTFDKYGVE